MKWIFIALLALFSPKLFSQDTIIFKSRDTIPAKVLDETATEIRYKRLDKQDGLIYMVSKSRLARIRYENGTEVVFSKHYYSESSAELQARKARRNERVARRRARRVIVNEPDLWNHAIINYWENPALAGEDRQIVQTTDFDNDHSGDYIRTGIDFPVHRKKHIAFALGPYFAAKRYGSESGNSRKTLAISGSFKYHFQNQSDFSAGVSGGFVDVRTSRFSSYDFFEAHLGDTAFFPKVREGWDSAWAFDTKYTRFGPLNIGVWYNGKNCFAGASIMNVTRYDEGVFGEHQPSPLYFSMVAGYHLNIKGKAFLTPSLAFRTQGFTMHSITPRLTASLSRSRLLLGTYYEDKRIYGVFGFDLASHFQVTFALGGSVARQDIRPGIYFAGAVRLH
ncbi:MAG TPA: type IX secretion system membrane protein PorP/SprF, partial [Chitinophagales bacterium]|nr:type IX secretion system membrane protein PorP/SprF [Chitinophagales bacterium]